MRRRTACPGMLWLPCRCHAVICGGGAYALHDTLVWEQGAPVYPAERVEASGSFFTVEDTRTGETLLAARHAPITPAPGPQFLLAENCLCVLQNGCAGAPPAGTVGCTCVLGTAPAERLWEQYRAFYRLGWQAP